MYTQTFVALLAAASTAQAFSFSDITTAASNLRRSFSKGPAPNNGNNGHHQRTDICPEAWYNVSTTLTGVFLADGQCTDAARAAIRAAFHDCFNNGCDGSLILADECSNDENLGMSQVCGALGTVAAENKVGYGDMIQFAAGKSDRLFR